MPTSVRRQNRWTKRIENLLRAEFPTAEAYQYNSASIRVRIVDSRFRGLSNVERDERVAPLLDSLSEEDQSYVTILLLLAPDETDRSMMNVEFEHPTPSRL